ncbi:hypothetical protein GGF41_000384 [Coemansia sp. RSA 2531]|nr:hypothetical protein GGF41_000384 [Coemansia sp. RSA 2531]
MYYELTADGEQYFSSNYELLSDKLTGDRIRQYKASKNPEAMENPQFLIKDYWPFELDGRQHSAQD